MKKFAVLLCVLGFMMIIANCKEKTPYQEGYELGLLIGKEMKRSAEMEKKGKKYEGNTVMAKKAKQLEEKYKDDLDALAQLMQGMTAGMNKNP